MENLVSVFVSTIASLPAGVRALGVFAVGLAAAVLVRLFLFRLLELVRFNKACDALGISEFLRKGQARHQPSRLVGFLAYWTVLLLALFQIARILDLGVVNSFSDRLTSFVPGVLAGAFIGTVGAVVVSFIANFVMTVARNAGFAQAALLSQVVKVIGYALVVGLALEQIDLVKTLLSGLFQIVFAAVAFGLALAFGLGCKDIARDAAMRIIQNLREKKRLDGRSDLEG